MIWKGDRKRGIKAMALVGLLATVILLGAVFVFHLISRYEQDNYAAVSLPQSGSGRTDSPESTEEIPRSEDRRSSEENTENRIYIVKGDSHRSNRYEKVDHLSYTQTVCYTKEDLTLLDSDGLRVTRNEIFARHGRMFNDQSLQEYFSGQDWYIARYSPENFDDDCLNEVEKYNAGLIRAYEIGDGMNIEAENK